MSEAEMKTTAHSLEVAELEIERLPLSEVTPHPQNPNVHTEEQIQAIMESLELDGYIAGTMGIQKSTLVLYKGHGVLMALKRLDCQEADFVVSDLTDAETLALLARDNALSDMSTNDPVKLKVISVNLQEMNVPIERMGYTLERIEDMNSAWDVDGVGFPALASGGKAPFQQMTFTLADEQAEQVKSALAKAKAIYPFVDTGNENSNGNALARMAETYLGQS